MNWYQILRHALIGFCLCLIGFETVTASDLQQEFVTTTPVVADGVLYVASSTYPGHRGHLRAIDLLGTSPETLWDAAERMPFAGVGNSPGELTDSDPPSIIKSNNQYRTLFTNLSGRLSPLTTEQSGRLRSVLRVASTVEAENLLHAVRGRLFGSLEQVAGSREDPQRLWGISSSSPVLVGSSPFSVALRQRDHVLYCGAEDGMLHAFFVSRRATGTESYPTDDPDGGKELWAYLPGSFLPHLKNQPLNGSTAEIAVHLDGSPVVRELFIDLDGDGIRRWHTLLAATGTMLQSRISCVFVLDVTDPYHPVLLWENILPGENVGRTRGVTIGGCGDGSASSNCLYLTADFAEGDGAGIHALGLDLATGRKHWQFTVPYSASGPVAEATPAIPALMDLDQNNRRDTLVFGDLAGQLWALSLKDGHAHGDAPVFVVPGGGTEPIGAAVAVQGSTVIFGTGGVEHSDNHYRYAVYAVDLLTDGSRLRWTYPLEVGEKVWERPVVDASGHLIFGTSVDYLSLARSGEQSTTGRIVSLDKEGEENVSHDVEAATLGRVVTAPGLTVSVALTGEVTQFGTARRSDRAASPGSVKVFSWRQR